LARRLEKLENKKEKEWKSQGLKKQAQFTAAESQSKASGGKRVRKEQDQEIRSVSSTGGTGTSRRIVGREARAEEEMMEEEEEDEVKEGPGGGFIIVLLLKIKVHQLNSLCLI